MGWYMSRHKRKESTSRTCVSEDSTVVAGGHFDRLELVRVMVKASVRSMATATVKQR